MGLSGLVGQELVFSYMVDLKLLMETIYGLLLVQVQQTV